MKVESIKTHRIKRGDSIESLLDSHLPKLGESSVLAISSKVISIAEGRCVKKATLGQGGKLALIKQEADLILQTGCDNSNGNSNGNGGNNGGGSDADESSGQGQGGGGMYLTIKSGMVIPSAGIDESNADDQYVLYPSNVWHTAGSIWQHLRTRHGVKNLGVIITDSNITIMRRGVTGMAIGWCGLTPLRSYIGKPDLYGRPLKMTQVNVVDSLAATAVFAMGEGSEQTPMALIQNIPQIEFTNGPPSIEEQRIVTIDQEEDLYGPLIKSGKWWSGQGSSR